jgi:uncharacterized protein YutE (UPF0331/DUF86 family)
MRLDLKRIEAKIQFIEENLAFLRELGASSEQEFAADRRSFYAAIHALQISIEALLDIFSHIVARLHLGAPSNDREILEVMLKKERIPEAHFRRYLEMGKFRNKVVHGYIDVDPRTVYKMLQTELGDFRLFFDDVRRIIESEQARGRNAADQRKTNPKR